MAKEELRVSCAVGILRAMQVFPYARTIAAFVKTPVGPADQLFSQPLKHCTFAPRVGNIIMLLCKELFSQPLEQW